MIAAAALAVLGLVAGAFELGGWPGAAAAAALVCWITRS